MRKDALGFFWQDLPPPPRVPKEPVRCVAPEPHWLGEYPEIDPHNFKLISADELVRQSRIALDIEIYENYFLACLMGFDDGNVFYLESPFTSEKAATLRYILANCTTYGFNSLRFDLPLCEMAIAGATTHRLKQVSDSIILYDERVFARQKYDHVDLIEIAPLRASLKTYAGRLHTVKMQDLPFDPSLVLDGRQVEAVRHYCVNDLRNTILLAHCLEKEIELRYDLSNQYRIDLRSKSDAQIAEAVIGLKMSQLLNRPVRAPGVEAGKTFYYTPPDYVQFKTPVLQSALAHICNTKFEINFVGEIENGIGSLSVEIGDSTYSLGVGGLHSSEQRQTFYSTDEHVLIDTDVTSYYPFITLNLGLYPKHLGPQFLNVLRTLVDQRLEAKRAGNKRGAESLKIVVNGAFGKYGSPHSILYSPENLIKVTISGQLSLLLLIEGFELAGIKVVSANTDGVTILCKRIDQPKAKLIIADWVRKTGFEIEENIYRGLFSRDVNNYIALKEDGTFKTKGAYSDHPFGDPMSLHKNPVTLICVKAVKAYLTTGKPIGETVNECQDIRQFVVVRNVKGGAVQLGEKNSFIGKVARWYYAKDITGSFVYANSGRKVPKSLGARPLMQLPEQLPPDLDHDWYIREAERILSDVGVT